METNTIGNAIAAGARTTSTPAGSPHTYTNSSARRQNVIVSGGTVTTIEFSRDGATFDIVGLLAGVHVLNPGDQLRITYAVAPAVAIYPL